MREGESGDRERDRGWGKREEATAIYSYSSSIQQLRQISTECGVNFPVGRRQANDDDDDEESDDDDDIPFLPAIIRSRALRLRGGPFDDGKFIEQTRNIN